MKFNYVILFLSLFFVQHSFSQVKEFDKLEMLFDQGHYKMVFRKSKMLLDNPEYDYSVLPNYYKGLAALMLVNNPSWIRRHSKSIYEDITLFQNILSSKDWDKHKEARNDELSRLKDSLIAWNSTIEEEQLKIRTAEFVSNYLSSLQSKKKPQKPIKKVVSKSRTDLLEFAESLIGTPYVYAGETPNGFDCSGFVYYLFKQKYDIELPRKASDQQEKSESIKEKDVIPGDLIFFDSGKGVSHVGIVYSIDSEIIKMIHASSSKGIIVTDVSNSTYWKSKIHSYGRVLK